jgi:hypothetical protein
MVMDDDGPRRIPPTTETCILPMFSASRTRRPPKKPLVGAQDGVVW